ncbi:hypothetical protein SKAU_G00376920 [Synaphobranchus kaupii]|uniref:Uncharacterized protein n=1 Tax=Synaphobranchus kaupii TaxID=118154 RepID=A0A9Q1ECW0_SYNKA|nr:hypothetical protein SKAU_G00376920 [Synaphobranchus kaupii]
MDDGIKTWTALHDRLSSDNNFDSGRRTLRSRGYCSWEELQTQACLRSAPDPGWAGWYSQSCGQKIPGKEGGLLPHESQVLKKTQCILTVLRPRK